MRGIRGAAVCAAVLAVVAVTGAACGVPGDAHARPIAADDVPFGLLADRAGSPSTTVASADTEVSVYLVSGERLAEVRRPFAAGSGLKGLLALVTSGPTDAEAAAGLRSALPATAVVDAATSNGEADVSLSETFASLDSREQVLAIAQIVYTATGDPGINAVRFAVDGKSVEVPNGQASLVTRPVTRADYAALAPP